MAPEDPLRLSLRDAVLSAAAGIHPSRRTPVTDSFAKAILAFESSMLKLAAPQATPAHRSSHPNYGRIPMETPRDARVVHVDLRGQDWVVWNKFMPIGLYCPPGETVLLRFPPAATGKGLRVRVSQDANMLVDYRSHKQSPHPGRDFPVDAERIAVASHMGGPIFLDIPKQTALGSFDMVVLGAVPMRYFRYGRHTNRDWLRMRERTPNVTILDTDVTYNMSAGYHAERTEDMEAAARYWDRAYRWMAWGRGWDKYKPPRFPIFQYALLQTRWGFNSGLTANYSEGLGWILLRDTYAYKMRAAPWGYYHEGGTGTSAICVPPKVHAPG